MSNKLKHEQVPPGGIEPPFRAPEARALSLELRGESLVKGNLTEELRRFPLNYLAKGNKIVFKESRSAKIKLLRKFGEERQLLKLLAEEQK